MPNWTQNTLKVKGSDADLKKFEEDMDSLCRRVYPKNPEIIFSYNLGKELPMDLRGTISPRPKTREELIELAKKYNWDPSVLDSNLKMALTPDEAKRYDKLLKTYGVDNWYDWCCENWGVKWDTVDSSKERTPRMLVYRFMSPWGAPEAAIYHIANKYPNLQFVMDSIYEGEDQVYRFTISAHQMVQTAL